MVSEQELREINHGMERAMTADQIREMLEGVDGDAKVFFVCDYGDYHNTPQALPVSEIMDGHTSADLATTAYSQSGLKMVDRDPSDESREFPEDEEFPVVFLQM